MLKTYKVTVDEEDTIHWYNEAGKLHRENGLTGPRPAVECANGRKEYYIDGKRHREDGPAVEGISGYKEYWLNDKLHREDGPAIEFVNGYKEYYLNGTKYSYEEWFKLISNTKELTVKQISD